MIDDDHDNADGDDDDDDVDDDNDDDDDGVGDGDRIDKKKTDKRQKNHTKAVSVRMTKICPGETVRAPIFKLFKIFNMFKILKIFKISNNIVQAKLSELQSGTQ